MDLLAKILKLEGELLKLSEKYAVLETENKELRQAIRFIVIDRIVTQGTRSENGRKANERLWTVIATCALQGESAFDFILKSVQAYFYAEPFPSLIPIPVSDTS